jgi:hypothetical protein
MYQYEKIVLFAKLKDLLTWKQSLFEKCQIDEWLAQLRHQLEVAYNQPNRVTKLWRRLLIPYGLALRNIYLTLVRIVLQQILHRMPKEKQLQKYKTTEFALNGVVESLNYLWHRLGEEIFKIA